MATLVEKLQRIEQLKTICRQKQEYFKHHGSAFLAYRAGLLSAQMDFLAEKDKMYQTDAFAQYVESVREGCIGASHIAVKSLESGQKDLSVEFIQELHKHLLTPVEPDKAGHWRRLPARWKNSTMIVSNYHKIPQLMDELVDGFNQNAVPAFYWEERPNLEYQALSYHPIMQAIQVNYDIVSIHPFADGNKRVAKLVSNWILMRSGFAPIAIKNREQYIKGVENYFNTRDPVEFHDAMFQEIEQSHRETIQEIDKFVELKQEPRAIFRYVNQTRSRLNQEIFSAKMRDDG